ncbi:MAG: hypothetical protein QOD63_1852 [Actinomycetota bacterium]|jgi:hypothetical protein|nr:hypothetical protein [Actinomycetota bacterium]
MAADAFIIRGLARVYIVPAVAVRTAPTRAEINAGTNLTASVAGISGFALENQVREFAPVGAAFTEQRAGVDKVTGPCTLTLYEQKTTATIRAAVVKGSVGFVILVPYGDVVARRCEVWPVRVVTVATLWETTAAITFRAVFAPSAAPSQSAVLPA